MKTGLKIITVLAFISPAIASASFADETQSRSDLGQKLQLQLQEANNIYTRSIQAKSNIASTHNKTADALVQNIKG